MPYRAPRGAEIPAALQTDALTSPTPASARPFGGDSPFVRFKEFQPLPSPAAIARAKAASSPAPIGMQKENVSPMANDAFNNLLKKAVGADKRGVAFQPSALSTSLRDMSLATATAAMELTGAMEDSAHASDSGAGSAAPLKRLPDAVERAQMDAALQKRRRELQRARALADKIKLGPKPPSNLFIGSSAEIAAKNAASGVEARVDDWEALPPGTRISVWWEGSQEAYECTIRDWHVAVGEGGRLFYTHRCEYDGGTFDHDLSTCDFEVIEVPPDPTVVIRAGEQSIFSPTPSDVASQGAPTDRSDLTFDAAEELAAKQAAASGSGAVFGNNLDELTPKRRWLAKQEAELADFHEQLEQADLSTPLQVGNGKEQLKGRALAKRMCQPQAPTPRTPRATSLLGALGSLGASPRSMRLGGLTARSAVSPQQDGSGTAIVDPSDALISYRKVVQTPHAPATQRVRFHEAPRTGR